MCVYTVSTYLFKRIYIYICTYAGYMSKPTCDLPSLVTIEAVLQRLSLRGRLQDWVGWFSFKIPRWIGCSFRYCNNMYWYIMNQKIRIWCWYQCFWYNTESIIYCDSRCYNVYLAHRILALWSKYCWLYDIIDYNNRHSILHIVSTIPSRELINIPPKWHFEDDFPFPKVGYVNSLEGIIHCISVCTALYAILKSFVKCFWLYYADTWFERSTKKWKWFPSGKFICPLKRDQFE